MKYLYSTLVISALFSSCGQSPKKNVQSGNIPDNVVADTSQYYSIKDNTIKVDFNHPEQVSVFDYFKSIELIPLETNDDVIIGRLEKMLYHQDRYYTLDKQQHIVHVFDKQGQFIFKIDKRGQGPGEYPFLNDIAINNSGNLELLCAMGFVYEYDLSGKYIKTTKISSSYIRAVHGLISLDKYTRVFFAAFHHPYRLIYYDLNEKKILHEEFEESDMFGGSYEYFSFYQYNGNWWFFRPYCNDVYKVGIDKFEISYTWDFGKFNLDHKKVHFSEQAKNNVYKLYDELKEKFTYRFSEIGENNRYVIAHAKIKGEFANLIYDKSIQQSRYIDKFTESVIMCPMIVTNEYLLDFCNPGELEEHLTENMLGETNKKIFNDLIHSGDANPIIIKFNFK